MHSLTQQLSAIHHKRGFDVPQNVSQQKCSIYPQCIMWMDKTGVYKIV